MFVMLIIILEAASLGVLAYLAKDGVYVIDYIISKSNLDNVEPLVFGNTADEFSKNIIEICVPMKTGITPKSLELILFLLNISNGKEASSI